MGWLFEFLFKYPRVVFEQGDFTFAASRSMTLDRPGVAGARRRRAHHLPRGHERRDRRASAWCWSRSGSASLAVLWSACSARRWSCGPPCRSRTSSGVIVDDSRSMTIADRDGLPRTDFVQKELADRGRAAQGAVRPVRPAPLPLLHRRRSPEQRRRPEVCRHVVAPRARARAGARRARRPAARRPGAGHRRRRHLGRGARRVDRGPEGPLHPGVHGRPRPRVVRARRADHARRNAARRP